MQVTHLVLESSPASESFSSGATTPAESTACRRFCARMFPAGYKKELVQLIILAWPAIITSLLQFLPQTVSVMMCGHLTKIELDAAALANTLINLSGIGIGLGLSTGCDTLFSQTYGSSNKKRVGMYLQRSLLVMYLFLFPIYSLHLNIEPILIALGQHHEISRKTADYLLAFLPGIFCDYTFMVLARYMQTQNKVHPPMICALIGNVCNIASQYVCIYVLGFSYISSAVCQFLCLFIMAATLLVYIVVTKSYEETWDGFKREALYDWDVFIKLAVPGMFMIGLEEWFFEIGAFVGGAISPVQLGVQSLLMQMEWLSYMIPFGISIAVNIRVGQHIGSWNPPGAITSYRVSLTMTLTTAAVMSILFITLRNYLPLAFSNDADIIRETAQSLPLIGAFQYVDGILACGNGVVRGCGRQFVGAILVFVAYYLIALPIGLPLCLLTDLQITGFWIGIFVGVLFSALVYVVVVLFTDWHKQCQEAADRSHEPLIPLTDTDNEGASKPSSASESTGILDTGNHESEQEKVERHRRQYSFSGRFPVHHNKKIPKQTRDHRFYGAQYRRVVIIRLVTLAVGCALLAAAVVIRITTSMEQLVDNNNYTIATKNLTRL